MRIYARKAGVLDAIAKCADCGGPMVKVGIDYRCMDKVEPEELVATGFIPSKGSDGKLHFESNFRRRIRTMPEANGVHRTTFNEV